VYGAYNSYQFQKGSLAIKAGYRLEYTTLSGKFRSGMDLRKSDYLNIIPAVSLLYGVNPQSSVFFDYTNRIERPRIYQLDPFADRSVPNYLSYGNPGLRPAMAHNLELNYRSGDKRSMNANLSYSFSDNIIQQVSRYEPESNSAVTTYENTGTGRQLKLYLDAGGSLDEKLNISVNALLARGWFSGQVAGQLIKRTGYNSHLGLNVTQKLSSNWSLSGSLNYAGQETRLQDITNGQLYNTFRIYGDLVENKLSASLSLNNPFIQFRYYERSVNGVGFHENYRGQSYARSAGFSLSWQLGSLEGGVKKNERKISVDDGKP
jgi:outer membrane receptor protein involved in Fe transport